MVAFQEELKPSGEVGKALVRRAAVCSVRMDRGVEQETAALSERVRKAEAEFVPPEGASPEEAARLRAEAGRRAMFDPSREATLARKYEAASERGFFRALKELRQLEKQAKAAEPIDPAAEFQNDGFVFLFQLVHRGVRGGAPRTDRRDVLDPLQGGRDGLWAGVRGPG